jgi:hypothetical protein
MNAKKLLCLSCQSDKFLEVANVFKVTETPKLVEKSGGPMPPRAAINIDIQGFICITCNRFMPMGVLMEEGDENGRGDEGKESDLPDSTGTVSEVPNLES